jgi:hypothetical protein
MMSTLYRTIEHWDRFNHGEHGEHGEEQNPIDSPCSPCSPWLDSCVSILCVSV